jgi:hypothetical protein
MTVKSMLWTMQFSSNKYISLYSHFPLDQNNLKEGLAVQLKWWRTCEASTRWSSNPSNSYNNSYNNKLTNKNKPKERLVLNTK